jgi:hypothetical protein
VALSLDRITAVSRAVIAQERRDVELVSVLPSAGGSDHIELLVRITDSRDEPCRAVLSLTRLDEAKLESDLRVKLTQTLLPQSARDGSAGPES